jgi:hypothetical protein
MEQHNTTPAVRGKGEAEQQAALAKEDRVRPWEGRPLGLGRREREGPKRAQSLHWERQRWIAGGDN